VAFLISLSGKTDLNENGFSEIYTLSNALAFWQKVALFYLSSVHSDDLCSVKNTRIHIKFIKVFKLPAWQSFCKKNQIFIKK